MQQFWSRFDVTDGISFARKFKKILREHEEFEPKDNNNCQSRFDTNIFDDVLLLATVFLIEQQLKTVNEHYY